VLESWDKRADLSVDDLRRPRLLDLVFNAKLLAERLIQEFLCFGEGPRFSKQVMDNAASNFLGNARDSSLALPIPIA
jgi:hypothetical protein